MAAVPAQTKRDLGRLLVGLREKAGLYGTDAARHLGCAPSTYSRYESGQTSPGADDLETLLNLYGADEDVRAEAADRWAAVQRGTARMVGSSAVPPKFRSFLRAEADADNAKTLAPIAVPGLLQTEAYAHAVHQSGRALTDPTIPADRVIAARMSRQQRLLLDSSPLALHALLDEAVIRRCASMAQVGYDQLTHLTSIGQRPNVTIQVVPYSAGVYGTMSGPMTRFRYPKSGDGAAVYLEYPGGGAWVRGAEVEQYELLLHEVEGQALTPEDTAALITEAGRT
ncbi:MAG: helix-turn-helix transcriptional regulator [Umezawaea sp.]